MSKTGLILEGGAMRGLFTAGVTDVLMENGITFDGGIGVSAGATFGCNYKSHQIGRTYEYNIKYCDDERYGSWKSFFKTGDVYEADFCYNMIPNELEPFDYETFEKNPMEFYYVATDVETGKAVYHKATTGKDEDLLWVRASASMPIVSQIVEVDGYKLLDGGISDSIPIRFFESIGYDHNVVILTQPRNFVKEKNSLLPIIRISLKDYPKCIEAIEKRHHVYNETTFYIKGREALGHCLVIQPEEPLNISAMEDNPEEIDRVYQLGRKAGEKYLEPVKAFLNKK